MKKRAFGGGVLPPTSLRSGISHGALNGRASSGAASGFTGYRLNPALQHPGGVSNPIEPTHSAPAPQGNSFLAGQGNSAFNVRASTEPVPSSPPVGQGTVGTAIGNLGMTALAHGGKVHPAYHKGGVDHHSKMEHHPGRGKGDSKGEAHHSRAHHGKGMPEGFNVPAPPASQSGPTEDQGMDGMTMPSPIG